MTPARPRNYPLILSGVGALLVAGYLVAGSWGQDASPTTGMARPTSSAHSSTTSTTQGPSPTTRDAAADDVRSARSHTGSGSETTAGLGTSAAAAAGECIDRYDSYNWPTTTEGPIVECPENPFGVPDSPLSTFTSGWIVVLESIDISEIDLVNDRVAHFQRLLGGVKLIDSRMHAGLRDPYWVPSVGPFEGRDEASAFCLERPRLDPCYPRELDP